MLKHYENRAVVETNKTSKKNFIERLCSKHVEPCFIFLSRSNGICRFSTPLAAGLWRIFACQYHNQGNNPFGNQENFAKRPPCFSTEIVQFPVLIHKIN